MPGRSKWLITLLFVLLFTPVSMAGGSEDVKSQIEAIRARLRAEAKAVGAAVTKSDVLPTVIVTILPKDSYQRLAHDLTGSADTQKALRSLAPSLKPGTKVEIPRALLRPELTDTRIRTFHIGEDYKSLWGLARGELRIQTGDIPLAVRNIQRLNGVVNGAKLHKGQEIRLPVSMLEAEPAQQRPFKIYDTYRVSRKKEVDRKSASRTISAKYRGKIKKKGLWARQKEKPPIDLVVIHTTEHQGAKFANVAKYMKLNRAGHYLISRDGKIYRIVPEEKLAYGCGQSLWDGRYEVDHGAINIELFADTDKKGKYTGITDAQYASMRLLLADIQTRRPAIHTGRIVTHRMVSLNYKYDMRQRKGDPYEFDWEKAGLPDNSAFIDQDLLLGRAKLHDSRRYADRITSGMQAAARMRTKM